MKVDPPVCPLCRREQAPKADDGLPAHSKANAQRRAELRRARAVHAGEKCEVCGHRLVFPPREGGLFLEWA